MMGKLPLLLGLGAGYILGSRAGRGHYDKLSDGVNKMWNDPRVQDKVETAKEKAPVVASKFSESAKTKAEDVKTKVANRGDKGTDASYTGGQIDDLGVTTTPATDVTTTPGADVTSDSWAKAEQVDGQDAWKKDETGL